MRISLGPTAGPCPKAGPVMAARTSAIATLRRGVTKTRRRQPLAFGSDWVAASDNGVTAQRLSIKARICLPLELCVRDVLRTVTDSVSALLAEIVSQLD